MRPLAVHRRLQECLMCVHRRELLFPIVPSEDLVAVLQAEYGLTQPVAEWIAAGLQKCNGSLQAPQDALTIGVHDSNDVAASLVVRACVTCRT